MSQGGEWVEEGHGRIIYQKRGEGEGVKKKGVLCRKTAFRTLGKALNFSASSLLSTPHRASVENSALAHAFSN